MYMEDSIVYIEDICEHVFVEDYMFVNKKGDICKSLLWKDISDMCIF